MIRLYAFVNGTQWSLALVKLPNLPHPRTNPIFVKQYGDEREAKEAMGTLGLLIMKNVLKESTLTVNEAVSEAVDAFKRTPTTHRVTPMTAG